MAVSFIGQGAAASGSNTNLAPGTPSGTPAVGDLYVAFLGARTAAAGASFAQTGWNAAPQFPHTNGTATATNKLFLLWKMVVSASESPGTFTYSGGSANETVVGQVACFRGCQLGQPFRQVGTFYDGINTQNIGAITGLSGTKSGNAVLVIGHKADDWTSVATLTADTDSYVEIGEPDETTGNDAGIVWDYLLLTADRNLSNRTFTVTGGGSQFGCAVYLELQQAVIKAPPVWQRPTRVWRKIR